MAKKSPSNSSVAKKVEAIRKAVAKKRNTTAADKVAKVKKSASKKAGNIPNPEETKSKPKPVKTSKPRRAVKPEAKPKKEEPKGIDYESYKPTPTVVVWRNMVQGALDRYEASLPEKPTNEQLNRAEILRGRIHRAAYELRNAGSIKRYTAFKDDVGNTQKVVKTNKKPKAKPKKK